MSVNDQRALLFYSEFGAALMETFPNAELTEEGFPNFNCWVIFTQNKKVEIKVAFPSYYEMCVNGANHKGFASKEALFNALLDERSSGTAAEERDRREETQEGEEDEPFVWQDSTSACDRDVRALAVTLLPPFSTARHRILGSKNMSSDAGNGSVRR